VRVNEISLHTLCEFGDLADRSAVGSTAAGDEFDVQVCLPGSISNLDIRASEVMKDAYGA
jgi:hypothetical protein